MALIKNINFSFDLLNDLCDGIPTIFFSFVNPEIYKYMLDNHFNLIENTKDDEGNIFLHYIIAKFKTFKIYLKHEKFDRKFFYVKNNMGLTPISTATNSIHKFKFIINKSFFDKEMFGDFILASACSDGNIKVVKYILDNNLYSVNDTKFIFEACDNIRIFKLITKSKMFCDEMLVVKDDDLNVICHAFCNNTNVFKYILGQSWCNQSLVNTIGENLSNCFRHMKKINNLKILLNSSFMNTSFINVCKNILIKSLKYNGIFSFMTKYCNKIMFEELSDQNQNILMLAVRYKPKLISKIMNHRFFDISMLNQMDENGLNTIDYCCKYNPKYISEFIKYDFCYDKISNFINKNKNKLRLSDKYLLEYIKNMSKINNNECPICYNEGIDVVFNNCGHELCCKCFKKIDKCPMCRSKIKTFRIKM